MQRQKITLIDDDPTLFDLPAEWFFPHLPRARGARDESLGLSSLAADVDLQSGRRWPRRGPSRARLARDWRHRDNDNDDHFPDAA